MHLLGGLVQKHLSLDLENEKWLHCWRISSLCTHDCFFLACGMAAFSPLLAFIKLKNLFHSHLSVQKVAERSLKKSERCRKLNSTNISCHKTVRRAPEGLSSWKINV